tara:strand:- start:384 stop:590 length:207 start_codon:yes stop_codon:yes gene_type:complete
MTITEIMTKIITIKTYTVIVHGLELTVYSEDNNGFTVDLANGKEFVIIKKFCEALEQNQNFDIRFISM